MDGKCVTQRNGSGIHVDHKVETREHDSASTTNLQKLVPEVVIESTRVTSADKVEESDENHALESQIDGERRNDEYETLG